PRRRARAPPDERTPAARPVVPGQGSARVDVQGARTAETEGRAMSRASFDLTGRTAVVVGGTTGIGRALALGLADAGADVVATGRRPAAVDDVSAAIEQRGRRTLRHPADVGDRASLQTLCDACLKAFTHVDIVVAAAGITRRTPSLEVSETEWNQILDTNVTGMFRT